MKMYVFNIKVNIFLKRWNQKAMGLQNKVQTTVWIMQDYMQIDSAICIISSDGVF